MVCAAFAAAAAAATADATASATAADATAATAAAEAADVVHRSMLLLLHSLAKLLHWMLDVVTAYFLCCFLHLLLMRSYTVPILQYCLI